MKVSIITVVYNNERTIDDAINSVLNQSHDNVEYIIIDGGSKDNTVSIIEKYKHRLAKFVSEPDKGLYDAMNKGVALATGEVVGILNSDDLYQDRNVIADVVNEFLEHPEVDMIYGDLVYVREEDTTKVVRNWQSMDYYSKFFENGNVPPHPSLFIKNKVYKQAGQFKLDYKLAADYEFMFRVFKLYSFKSLYITRLMVRMRLGGATNKSIANIVNGNKEILRAWTENGIKVPVLLMLKRFLKRIKQFI